MISEIRNQLPFLKIPVRRILASSLASRTLFIGDSTLSRPSCRADAIILCAYVEVMRRCLNCIFPLSYQASKLESGIRYLLVGKYEREARTRRRVGGCSRAVRGPSRSVGSGAREGSAV